MNIAITVNGVNIPEHAILAEMQHHPAARGEDALHRAAVALVVRELLRQEAARQDIIADEAGIDPEEGRINALLEQELRLPEPDEESCRRYFEQNRRRFHTPDLYQASHILVALDKDLPLMQAKARARRQAEALIAELSEHPYRFPDLARRYSACPSRELGGNLGQIGPGQTVAEFESALARMADGEISTSPVESRYGFHIIHLERRIPGQPLDYAAVRERIADYLRDSVYRRAVHQYVQRLIGRAEIHGIELSGADDPLVQ